MLLIIIQMWVNVGSFQSCRRRLVPPISQDFTGRYTLSNSTVYLLRSVEHCDLNPNLALIMPLQLQIWEARTVKSSCGTSNVLHCSVEVPVQACFVTCLERCQHWEVLCDVELAQMFFEKAQTIWLSNHMKNTVPFLWWRKRMVSEI